MKNPRYSKNKLQLLKTLKKLSFKKKRVVLASGKISNYYFDGRISSLSSQGSYLMAQIILDMIKKDKIDAIGGLTLGADPIIGATVALSFKRSRPIDGFIVRKNEKKHGMQRLIEGPELKKSSKVLIIDDVVTSGSSTIQAIKAVEKTGAKVARVIAIVDRCEGAKENLEKAGCKLESIFTISDFNI